MNNDELIQDVVNRYCAAISSQNENDFKSLWSLDDECILISIAHEFIGVDNIYQEFLIDRIQQKYSRIDLISEAIEIRYLTDNIASIVFAYHTECNLRENGEPTGIAGLETQIMKKVNNQWKLVHIHYSKKDPQ